MKQQKLILFDWGNGVESHHTGYNVQNAWNDLFKDLGYTGELNIFNNLGKYHLSTVSSLEELEETYYEIKNEFNLNADFSTFLNRYKYFFAKIDFYSEVRDYEISLKDRCYIGIFSNLMIIDYERLDKQVGLCNYDYIYLSYQLKMRKPNNEIYEYILNQSRFDAENILFIDDNLENVKAAQKCGWNSYQLNELELEKIKKACEKFLENN